MHFDELRGLVLRLIKQAINNSSSSVIEFQCDTAQVLRLVKEAFPNVAIYGVDNNDSFLMDAVKEVPGYFICADIYSKDFVWPIEDVSLVLIHVNALQGMNAKIRESFVQQIHNNCRKVIVYGSDGNFDNDSIFGVIEDLGFASANWKHAYSESTKNCAGILMEPK